MNSEVITPEATQSQNRAARLETWAEYLCLPISYVRQKLHDVTTKASGIDRQGKERRNAYYFESDIEERIPECKLIKEMYSIGKNRDDIRKEFLKSILISAGYCDRRTLAKVNISQFEKDDFPPFGKGYAFYSYVFNNQNERRLTRENLEKIAEFFDFPELSEKKKMEMQNSMINGGFPDKRSLQLEKPSEFGRKDFGHFGKGRSFITWILGEVEEGFLASEHLTKAAEILSLPDLSDNRKNEMKQLLRDADLCDRRSLEMESLLSYQSKDFGKYGKGRTFFWWVTGEAAGEAMYKSQMIQIAEVLQLPELSDERKNEMKEILAKNYGYADRRGMEMSKVDELKVKIHGKYGSIFELYTWLTGKKIQGAFTKEDLQEIYVLLELPVLCEERKDEMRKILSDFGYSDRRSFQFLHTERLRGKNFGNYGKQANFYRWVTGDYLSNHASTNDFFKVTDALEIPELSDQRKEEMIAILKVHGYSDLRSLERENTNIFGAKVFGRYGKGKKFYRWVTGEKTLKDAGIKKTDIIKMAKILGLPELSDEHKNEIRELFILNGFEDERSIQMGSIIDFREKQFGKYGKIVSFLSWITGNKQHENFSKSEIIDITKTVGLPELSEVRKVEMRTLLFRVGISSITQLKSISLWTFSDLSFDRYGKGKNFYKWVTGKSIRQNDDANNFQREHLLEIGLILGLPAD